MKKFFIVFLFFMVFKSLSQNKQVLYGFAEVPQSLLLNPGAETNYKYHIGVPLLSGISIHLGLKGFVLADVFLEDNIPINDKVTSLLNQIEQDDYVTINSQIEIFNAGFRLDNKTYINFGLYEELDGIAYIPKDAIKLLNEGNSAFLNKSFDLSQFLYKIDLLGVFHAGFTRKVDEKFTYGARFKIYSSIANVESTNNTGTFVTREGDNNLFTHSLNNVAVSFKTSGIIKNDEYIDAPKSYVKNAFFGGNLGFGFDVGFTYHFSKQLEFTGSLLDLGFIRHKKNIKNSILKGNYIFEGVEFQFDEDNLNYWQDLDDDFEEKISNGESQDPYTSWRPIKINASLKYSFGKQRGRYCYDITYKNFYTNAIGAQLYSVFRPLKPQVALTGFYERSFSNKLHAKVTYTLDEYSFYNIGAGLSLQFGKVNFYWVVDNIAQFNDIASANSISLQLGINLIFN